MYGLTRGIPRLVNSLCDTAMIMACTANRDRVTIDSIDDALRELHWAENISPQDTSLHEELGPGSAGNLAITQNGAICSEHLLNLPSYIIGRSEECSVVLHDKYLSRHHALLAHSQSGWSISDLNSTNGITVNGRAVKIAKLSNGDEIGIGTYLMRITLEDPQPHVSDSDDKTSLYPEIPDLAAS